MHSYADSVRANIAAAGDNCSRILFGGALWAAAVGGGLHCKIIPRLQLGYTLELHALLRHAL